MSVSAHSNRDIVKDLEVSLPKHALMCVVGARPNFMKIAPIMRQFGTPESVLPVVLVHTGQHYDAAMKDTFFDQLGIPVPDIDLGVGSGSHAVQTAEIMLRFEPVLDLLEPRAILVVGDVNSTIACALVAVKKSIPVFHVESGLRSNDRNMPEEINRVLTDQISDLLFTTENNAKTNLIREGIEEDKIHFVGNVMIDTLHHNLQRAVSPEKTLDRLLNSHLGIGADSGYGLVTLHRPSNVDECGKLTQIVDILLECASFFPLVFAVHPRTNKALKQYGLERRLSAEPRIAMIPPQGYLEMLGLMRDASVVLTDSGGIQEETTALGVPCLTLRENTERPITIEQGTNILVGTDSGLIRSRIKDIAATGGKSGHIPELWDGHAAERIYRVIASWIDKREQAFQNNCA